MCDENYCGECKYLCMRYDKHDWEIFSCLNENGRGTDDPDKTACKGFEREV